MDAYFAVQTLENIKKRMTALRSFASSLKGSPCALQMESELEALGLAQEVLSEKYLKRFVLRTHLPHSNAAFVYLPGSAKEHFPNWSLICSLNDEARPSWLKSASVGIIDGDALVFECIGAIDLVMDTPKTDECQKWIEAVSISLSTEKKNE